MFSIVTQDGVEKILPPLTLIDGIGIAVMNELLTKRPFNSLEDLLKKVDRGTVHKGIMIKLIFSGTLNAFFKDNMSDVEKIQEYLNLKAAIEGKKAPESVPEEYRNLTPLKHFLIKKSVFKVYNEKLAPLAINKMESMGLAKKVTQSSNTWYVEAKSDYYGGIERHIVGLDRLEEYCESDKQHRFAVVSYITKAEEKPYANGAKTRLIVHAEIEDKVFEFIKWPEWKRNTHGVTEDIEGSVCVMILSKKSGSDSDIFVDEIKMIENLNFLKEEKKKNDDNNKELKLKRAKRKISAS
jgi:DNA polymerase III alpha subunit